MDQMVNLEQIEKEAWELLNQGLPTDEIQKKFELRLVFHRENRTGRVTHIIATPMKINS